MIEWESKCPHCNTKKKYSSWDDGYDAYYCDKCDIWLEPKCSNPECEFCSTRPDKPSEMKI